MYQTAEYTMSIIQISKIQVRTGNIEDLPQLSVGEFGWAIDERRLFIGNQPDTIGPIPDNTEILTNISSSISSATIQTTNLTTGANTISGTMTGNWKLTAGSKFESISADLAERYRSDRDYEPGTIVMIGGEREVTIADVSGKYRLAGVVSTQPAYVLNSTIDNSVIIALTGRVPCRVVGKINKGDLITVSDVPGVGTSISPPASGMVVGRSLQSYDSDEIGVIEIKVDQC